MDEYAAASLHGTLPLVVDRTTGSIRFAVPGKDPVSDCLRDAGELPPARMELFAFPDTRFMHAWLAGFRENLPNGAETVIPDIDWPWFLLVVRHDLDPYPGSSVDEAVPLRFAVGGAMPAEEISRKATESRKREMGKAARAAAHAKVAQSWEAGIAAIDRHPAMKADIVSSAGGEDLVVNVSTGDILGIGPSVSISRQADGGYLASWRWSPIGRESDEDAAARGEAASEHGVTRNGPRFHLPLQDIDEASLDRLLQAARAIENAKGRSDAPAFR